MVFAYKYIKGHCTLSVQCLLYLCPKVRTPIARWVILFLKRNKYNVLSALKGGRLWDYLTRKTVTSAVTR